MQANKYIVVGNTGMLGRYVHAYISHLGFKVVGLNRSDFDATEEGTYDNIRQQLTPGDIVINCVGIVKPYIRKVGIIDTIKINSIFPQALNNMCKNVGANMIHICSDCVYSGNSGNYTERDQPDGHDIYAKTKNILPECLVLRTSFVGEDLNADGVGLLQWVLSMQNQEINGYTNCIWNGVTCLQLAKCIVNICQGTDLIYESTVRHIFSDKSLTKYELCKEICNVYDLNIKINKYEPSSIEGSKINNILDRTLSTVYNKIQTDCIYRQIKDQRNFNIRRRVL